jgi:hypothetical protein
MKSLSHLKVSHIRLYVPLEAGHQYIAGGEESFNRNLILADRDDIIASLKIRHFKEYLERLAVSLQQVIEHHRLTQG